MTGAPHEPTASPARNVPLHPLSRRVMHWINALAIIVMIGSGWLTLGGDFTVTEAVSDEDGLANALAWHFASMWVLTINFLAFVIVGFASGHFRRDFLPLSPRAFLRDLWSAMRFKLDHRLGEYNAVQKALYCGVLAAILLTILSGLSIWKPVQLKGLTWLFGGYEFARVVHFFGMAAIVGFLVVHVLLTILVPKTFVTMVLGRVPGASRSPEGVDK